MNRIKKLVALSLCLSVVQINSAFCQTLPPAPVEEVIPVPVVQTQPVIERTNLTPFPNLIKADIHSRRLPVGTILRLRMETPVNSFNTSKGDTFRATLLEDVRLGSDIILPSGTIMRGNTNYVKPNGMLSRGGELDMTFDHVITPMGKLLPLTAKISRAKQLSPEGLLSAGGGYWNAVEQNLSGGTNFMIAATEYGIKLGKSFLNSYPTIVTVPLGLATGVVGGAGMFVVKSAFALIQKGDNVRVNPGDIIEVTLKESIDIPVN